MLTPLLLGTAASLIAAGVFVRVGWIVSRRGGGDAGLRRALRAFATFWFAVALGTLALAALNVAAAASAPLPMLVALRVGSILLYATGFWGLIGYLLFVYTGNGAWLARAAAFYAVLGVLLVAHITWARPIDVAITPWTVEVVLDRESALFTRVFAAAYLVPPLAATIAYLGLLPRAADAAQRRRVLLVGGGLLVWFASALLARLSEADAWQAFVRVGLGIGVALAVLAAFPAAPRAQPDREAREDALRERARQLI